MRNAFMKNSKLAFILIFLFAGMFVTQNAKATHLAAADIYVTYVGANADGCGQPDYQYEVTLKVYLACQTSFANISTTGTRINVRSQTLLDIDPNDPDASFSVLMTVENATPDTSHQLCGQFVDSNSCNSTTGRPLASRAKNFPAFRVFTFTANVTLPSAQKDWVFWYSTGARNTGTIENIDFTQNCSSLYVEAGLNNVTKYNNSTPRFVSNPLPYICVNQPTIYLNSPFDPNGDSMYVYQQTAYNNLNGPCTYAGGYSNNDPIGSTGDYKLNPRTGSATFTPTAQGFYVLAFRGEDYERGTGELLSYVYRDVQVTVLPCASPPPAIDSVKQVITSIKGGTLVDVPGQGEVVYACPGNDLEFSVNSETDSANHKVYMSATMSQPVAYNFAVSGNGTQSATGTFTWTPNALEIGDYTLTVRSIDSTCTLYQPIVLPNFSTILIRITDGLDAGKDLPTCAVNTDSVQLFARGGDYLRLKWTYNGGPATGISNDAINNPKAFTKVTTDYVISSPDLVGNCKSRDTVTVYEDKSNNVTVTPKNPTDSANALVMCRPGYLQLEALLVGRPPKNNVPCGTGNPTLCNDTETSMVFGSLLYGDLKYDTASANAPVFNNSLRTSRFQYLIKRDELERAQIFSSTLREIGFDAKGTSNAAYEYANFRILVKCTEKETLSTADGFENFGMTQVYFSPSETLEDGEHSYKFSQPYNWDTTKNLIVQICYSDNPTVEVGCGVTSSPPIISYVPTTYTAGILLRGADANVISVCGIDKSSDIEGTQARPAFRFTFCEASPLDYLVTWNRSEYLSDTTILQPLAYVPKSTSFVAQAVGRSTCIMRDTLDVYIPEHDFKVLPEDTAICLGDKTPFTVYGGHYFKWYEYEDGQYVDPLTTRSIDNPKNNYTFISPTKTTDYRIVVSDSVWCYDTLAVKVKILPLPDVRILNEDDTVVRYGQQFQLLASGAKLYNWSPVSSLNNPNISYPMARLTEDTKYIVGGIGSNGCRAFDTLHVIVDKKDNLFVPSAFSPNGDGKNDLFRVTNLSFQRIMEFRVFNRWGQEVYSTNDSRAGWDGTFEGKPQDMGTYSYLIRVAYPDGFVETYRGETTLIR